MGLYDVIDITTPSAYPYPPQRKLAFLPDAEVVSVAAIMEVEVEAGEVALGRGTLRRRGLSVRPWPPRPPRPCPWPALRGRPRRASQASRWSRCSRSCSRMCWRRALRCRNSRPHSRHTQRIGVGAAEAAEATAPQPRPRL